jgi:hypothetical protein
VPGACLHIDTASLVAIVGKSHLSLERYWKSNEQRKTATYARWEDAKAQGIQLNDGLAPGCQSDRESMDDKDLAWTPFFDWDHVVPPHRVLNQRFGHHMTTDGVSVSVKIESAPPGGFPDFAPLPIKKDPDTTIKPTKKRKTKKERNEDKKQQRDETIESITSQPFDYSKVVGADPGKHDLLYLTTAWAPDHHSGQKGAKRSRKQGPMIKTLHYTFGQRLQESGGADRNKWQKKKVTEEARWMETILSDYDHRANSLIDFQCYLQACYTVQPVMSAQYGKIHQRVVRWYNWRDRRASEDQFAQRVIKTFGRDAIIAYGSGSGFHALPGSPASPTVGLCARLAAKKHLGLRIVPTPEAYTTVTCSRCGDTLKTDPTRAKWIEKANRFVPPRGIRRCHSATCQGLRWNRDLNAAINIRANLIWRLEYGVWLFGPRRDNAATVGADTPDDEVLMAEREATIAPVNNNNSTGRLPLPGTAHAHPVRNLGVLVIAADTVRLS